MAIESKFQHKVMACLGGQCPDKFVCQLYKNLSHHAIWEKQRPPFKKTGCTDFKPIK